MKIVLDKGAYMPKRAHDTDAGLDIRAMDDFILYPYGAMTLHTGVHVQLPKGCAGLLVSKSGLNVKHSITSTGLIDEGYTGEIMVKLYNHSAETYFGKAGDKVSQLVVIPVKYEPVELVDSLETDTDRGNNGFGSTGR